MRTEAAVGTFDYVGSWQQPIPTALVLDPRLLPSEKLVWMVIRATQMRPGAPITTTYDYLAQACGLSRPTLSKALKTLQLTGWLRAQKQDTEGWVETTRYLMFDSDQSAQVVETHDFQDFARACMSQGKRLRAVALAVAKKFALKDVLEASSKKIELLGSKKTLPLTSVRSKEIELPEKLDLSSSKKIELPRARSSGSCVNNTTASERAGARELVWPNSSELTKAACRTDMALLGADQAQEVLDEFSAALARGTVKNPTMFLRSLVQSAIAGTFIYSDAGARVAAERTRNSTRPKANAFNAAETEDERRENHRAYVKQMRALGVFVESDLFAGEHHRA